MSKSRFTVFYILDIFFLALPVAAALLALALLCASAASAQTGPEPGTEMLLTDGKEVYPSNTLASAWSLQQASNNLSLLEAEVDSLRVQLTNSIASLDHLTASIGRNGDIVEATTFIQSVGASSGGGTNQVIKIESMSLSDSAITMVVSFNKQQGKRPGLLWTASLDVQSWTNYTDYVTSWPETVSCASAPQAFCYSYSIPRNGKPMFVRAISTDTSGLGSGVYFIVRNGLSISGRVGKTGTITDDGGTVHTLVGGLVVTEVTQ